MALTRTFAGRSLRTLRQTHRLRQGEMAARLGISTAYLSQLENDHRPLTEALSDQLRAAFPVDWRGVPASRSDPLYQALDDALSRDGSASVPSSAQVRRIAQQFPEFAQRFIDLQAVHQQTAQRLAMLDDAIGTSQALGGRLPWEEVRDWFHHADNYVDEIDRRAEHLAGQIARAGAAPELAELADWLEQRGVRIERDTGAALRSYDPHKRLLTLNSAQAEESLRFHLAWQIANLALGEEISAIVNAAALQTRTARDLLTVGLGNYAAGAMGMPYQRFADAARTLRHDVDRLRWIFGASFEQVCHRLSTLQRADAPGMPMFFCRVDVAGNITKRHSATRLQFARFGGACPLWVVHEAVAVPERIHVQLAEMPDGVRYVSIARGLVKQSRSYSRIPRRYAVALGCETTYASDFIYADEINLDSAGAATAIGTSCRICPRENCELRAYPPSDRTIHVNPQQRGIVPYEVEG